MIRTSPAFTEALRHPRERDEAAEAIRALIDRITLTPGAKRGEIAATLHGDLGTILEWTARTTQNTNTPGRNGAGVSASVVAGARSQCHYGNLSSMFVLSGLTPAAA